MRTPDLEPMSTDHDPKVSARVSHLDNRPPSIRRDSMSIETTDLATIADRLSAAIDRATHQVVLGNPRADDDLLRAEALRYLWRTNAVGLVSQIEGHDPAYPHFFKILSPWLNWGYPNPDGTYTFATLHGDHRY